MKHFNQKKFLVIFDDFDQTSLQKNVGLFVAFVAKSNVKVDIITNKLATNANLELPKNVNIIRLPTKRKRWPPLEDSKLYAFLDAHYEDYFALWIYRGRSYTLRVLPKAYERNIVAIVKLDSDGGFSFIFKVLSWMPKKGMLGSVLVFLARHYRFLPNTHISRWFLYYDAPLSLASVILCETPKLFSQMSYFFGKEKCLLFPNSIPVSEYKIIEDKLGKKAISKTNLIISVGRIVPGKNFDKAIIAFSKLPYEIRKNWKLKIIGPFYDQKYKKYLSRLIKRRKLTGQVLLVGLLVGMDLYEQYLKSKIMFMPYPKPQGSMGYEGQPNVLVEAMFFKSAILIVDVGNVAYLLADGKCGEIVPDFDADVLSRALIELIEKPARIKNLVKSARLRVEKHFNSDRIHNSLIGKIADLDYRFYLQDQKKDTIVGEALKRDIFKYCDFLTQKLAAHLDFNGKKILDIGCREFFTYDYFLEKYNNKIRGIDIGEEGLRFTRRKHVVNLDAHMMADFFRREEFDILIALHVFEHMYDLPLCLSNCWKILKQKGLVFFAIPIPSENTRRGHWVAIEGEKEMIKVCKEAGFDIIFHQVFKRGEFRGEVEMVGLLQKT